MAPRAAARTESVKPLKGHWFRSQASLLSSAPSEASSEELEVHRASERLFACEAARLPAVYSRQIATTYKKKALNKATIIITRGHPREFPGDKIRWTCSVNLNNGAGGCPLI